MKLKVIIDNIEYFIIKDDEGVKVTENPMNDINFSEQEANNIMLSLEKWSVLILKNITDNEYVLFYYENIILE